MKKALITTLIIIFLLTVIFISVVVGVYLAETTELFENYLDWKKVEIPTESELRATVKIPKNWDFIVENGRIKLKDNSGNVIAVECYEGWSYDYYENGVRHSNYDEIDVNKDLPEPYRDLDSYELEYGSSSSCYLYKITVDSVTSYALEMYIMDKSNAEGSYYLLLLFDSEIDDKSFYKKIQKSYHFGGFVQVDAEK